VGGHGGADQTSLDEIKRLISARSDSHGDDHTAAIVVRSLWAAERSSWVVGVLVGWVEFRREGENWFGRCRGMWWLRWTWDSCGLRVGYAPAADVLLFAVTQREEAGPMPQFQIEGEAEIFDAADEIDIHGEIARYSFVTAEKSPSDDKTVIISPIDPKDLSEFEGLLFQIDVNEEEDVVILRQVQMFFWPWEDDEEFEEMHSPDDESENT
jgi:hypothetical protein